MGAWFVAHAGLKEEMHGSMSNKARQFALFWEPTGEHDDTGRPVRLAWAADYKGYKGTAVVVHGHTRR